MKRVLSILVASLVLTAPAADATERRGDFHYVVSTTGAAYESIRTPSASWWGIDVVIIPDGFTEARLAEARALAATMVSEFLAVEPFASHSRSFNFWFVNHVCPDGETALVCHTSGRFPECSTILSESVCDLAEVPGADAIVIATAAVSEGAYWAGEGTPLIFLGAESIRGHTLAHEMGHLLAGLGDEYTCYQCDGSADDAAHCTPDDLGFPNLTSSLDVASIPWGDRILDGYTELPTTPANACNGEEIGAWEGGGYCEEGVYRPQEYCLMDGVLCQGNDNFCAVCLDEVDRLLPDLPDFGDAIYVAPLSSSMMLKWLSFDTWVIMLPPASVKAGSTFLEHNAVLGLTTSPAVRHPAARLLIVDDAWSLVASGTGRTAGEFSVEFTLKRDRTYYAVFYPGPRLDSVLRMTTHYEVDGVVQVLP